jgi:hypothetical protein
MLEIVQLALADKPRHWPWTDGISQLNTGLNPS